MANMIRNFTTVPMQTGAATLVYQEFKCDACEFRSVRHADVELHKRSVHMVINELR